MIGVGIIVTDADGRILLGHRAYGDTPPVTPGPAATYRVAGPA